MNKNYEIGGESPTNDAKRLVEFEEPYLVEATLQGTADLLFHRWSNEAVEEKSKARKGSKAKKTDDLESFVHRNNEGNLCLLGEQIRMALVCTAKFKQDPRSPRKSAMDLYKAGIIVLSHFVDLGVKDWDYIDKRRVVIQRSAITRSRPALKSGWKGTATIQVNLPEYISPEEVFELLVLSGRINGMGDFRPSYGRFIITEFKKI